MTTYAAVLRGINVAGNPRIGMAPLATVFAGLGCADVSTYQQTGNVLFTITTPAAAPAPDADADADAGLAARLETRIERDLGVRTTVVLRTGADLAAIVAGNPFADRQDDPTRLHVTFLTAAPAEDRIGTLAGLAAPAEEVLVVGPDVYLHCPNGYGRTRLSNANLERRLGVPGTTRNWKTVLALHGLASTGT
jgi:uncharacterized protein (DUF1697 family)